MMRVLTVRQPWAWAIIHGGKDVENRTRNIAGSYRGPVAIHAGKTLDLGALMHWSTTPGLRDLNPTPRDTARGGIIGVVNLWAVHPDRDNGNCCPHRPSGGPGGSLWADRGVWHLCVNDPQPLVEPLPWKGALGLRELSAEAEEEIMRRLA